MEGLGRVNGLFATEVVLIYLERTKEQLFTDLLKSLCGQQDQFMPLVQSVWSRMDSGISCDLYESKAIGLANKILLWPLTPIWRQENLT